MAGRVLLLAGPGGVGKTSTATRIAQHPDWEHISEDGYWGQLKAARPVGELRTPEEERIVQTQVLHRVAKIVRTEKNVVLEFILYQDPPHPLLNYQTGLKAEGIAYTTRILRAEVGEVLRRMTVRGRPGDAETEARRHPVEHQLRCLASAHIEASWVIDTSDIPLEEVYARHFRAMVER